MNYKDERKYLENELRSYHYIVNKCYEYENKIAEATVQKFGTSSKNAQLVIYENVTNPYKDKWIELDDIIDKAYDKLFIWKQRREWIEECLSRLSDPFEIKVIHLKYIYGSRKTDIQLAKTIGCHRNTLRNTTNRAFKKMLKK